MLYANSFSPSLSILDFSSKFSYIYTHTVQIVTRAERKRGVNDMYINMMNCEFISKKSNGLFIRSINTIYN